MDFQPAVPKDAASTILLSPDGTRVLWARRNPDLKFLGGFHSFPGGKVEEDDRSIPVRNCGDRDTAGLIACAARETFEEVGVLPVRNGHKLTKGQIVSLHDDLITDRSSFVEILDHWGLWIDAADFKFAGVWTTPEFMPMRFRTSFFLVRCPEKQIPYAAVSELRDVEFIESSKALEQWRNSTALMAPPLLGALRACSNSLDDVSGFATRADRIAHECIAAAEKARSIPDYLELNSRFICLPLRTKTLPPATHTNCFIVGRKRFVVIDPASPFEEEQEKLFTLVDNLIEAGGRCAAIIVSHLHPDHFGGETKLKEHLLRKHDVKTPIAGRPETAKGLLGKVDFDKMAPDTYTLRDDTDAEFELELVHTPGHAKGHLCFYDREFGFLLSSDNVVGEGSVVIAPPEGNMIDYLGSLEKMRSLPGLRSLCGSHGSAISDAKSKIEEYIHHRRERESQIENAIANGASNVSEIVSSVYAGLDAKLLPLAAKSVEAHLEKLGSEKSLPDWYKPPASGL